MEGSVKASVDSETESPPSVNETAAASGQRLSEKTPTYQQVDQPKIRKEDDLVEQNSSYVQDSPSRKKKLDVEIILEEKHSEDDGGASKTSKLERGDVWEDEPSYGGLNQRERENCSLWMPGNLGHFRSWRKDTAQLPL